MSKCGNPVKENFDLAQNKSANQKVKKEFKFSKFRLTFDFYLTIIIPILIFILSIALNALGTVVGFKSIIEPFMLIASFICSLIGFVLAIVSFVNTKNPASLCSIVFVIIVVILFIVFIRLGLKMAEAEGIL